MLPKFSLDLTLLLIGIGLLLLVGCRQMVKPTSGDSNPELNVADVIQTLSDQFRVMSESIAAEGKEGVLMVEEATIELSFVARRSEESKAGFEFDVVSVGGSQTYGTDEIQKITVKLTPYVVNESVSGPLQRNQ